MKRKVALRSGDEREKLFNEAFEGLGTALNFITLCDKSVDKAFYLGYDYPVVDEFRKNVKEEDVRANELIKSLDSAFLNAKVYLSQLAGLIKPFLEDENGFIIFDMVNKVLQEVELVNEEDLYSVAYILGIYSAHLFDA